MSDWKPGDVVAYKSERRDRWCREGLAIATQWRSGKVVLVDTFWATMSDAHVLTTAEEASAELRFNVADYDELPYRADDQWRSYAQEDRALITSQHGLQRRLFVRKGATEDLPTKIENARQALASAEEEQRRSEWRVEDRKRDLAALLEVAEAVQS